MSDLCPLCGADPTAVEALRARVAEVERERDEARADMAEVQARYARAWEALCKIGEALDAAGYPQLLPERALRVSDGVDAVIRDRDEARRERDARPDPGALLAALDAIRAASATGSTPAQLARMVEDVQAGMIRPPTGDGGLLGGERSCFTCHFNRHGVCNHPVSDLDMAIDQYGVDAGCAANNGGMPTNRSIRCPGWAAKEPK